MEFEYCHKGPAFVLDLPTRTVVIEDNDTLRIPCKNIVEYVFWELYIEEQAIINLWMPNNWKEEGF